MAQVPTETERKFLVALSIDAIRAKFAHQFSHTQRIRQCYLPGTGDWATRLRHTEITGRDYPEITLTLKRKINEETCIELETHLHWRQYDDWRSVCGPELKKVRHVFDVDGRCWYIDEFTQPELGGLLLAEVEYQTEGEHIDLPSWVDREVTDDPAYRNFRLVLRLEP